MVWHCHGELLPRSMKTFMAASPSVQWSNGIGGYLRLLDQTLLPLQEHWLDCLTVEQVWEAIRMLRVRGAPAIGIAAAYGVCVALRTNTGETLDQTRNQARQAIDYLATSRPTAVNLFWALDRMRTCLDKSDTDVDALRESMLAEARAIHEEDRAMCHSIGKFGATLLQDGWGVLTHCNAGGLATAEYGTALSAFFTAQDQGKKIHVYADETRPLLQGARLTAGNCINEK